MLNRERFFDRRNVKVAICGREDPLGKAFSVTAFHKTQATSVQSQE